jgi:hypothetical protein
VGLFDSAGKSGRPVLTINGRTQAAPERPNTTERRFRLYIECERRLAHDPLVQKFTWGHMVGRGSGLDGLVSKIAPLFNRERSLVRWVALRGAVACLWASILDPERSSKSPQELADIMGFAWVDSSGRPYGDSSGEEAPTLKAKEFPGQLSGQLRAAAEGTVDTVIRYVAGYKRFMDMSIYDANADPQFSQMSDTTALSCIAWSASARLRLGIAQPMFAKVPEPDALQVPSWYVEPVTAVCERYWDGLDWTAACRKQQGRGFKEFTLPLRPGKPAIAPSFSSLAQDTPAGRTTHPDPNSAGTHIASPAGGEGQAATGDPVLSKAIAQMTRIKAALDQLGLRFLDLGTLVIAAGVGIAYGQNDYLVLSVSAGGSEGVLNLTSGVLKDVRQDRLAILNICNKLTRDNPAYPVFLHDAEAGWDVLMQQRLLTDLLLADLSTFKSLIELLPRAAQSARAKFAEANLGGQMYTWTNDDIRRLLLRSVM